jgi:DNA-binding transcriptional ArsR family regulator
MKSSAPAILPLMRSRTQGDILAWIFLHPDQQYSIADIAAQVSTSEVTVLREVNRLAQADLIVENRQGRSRMVRPNPDNPATAPLTDLLAVTFGPVPILRETLSAVPGIEEAYIYGSWAQRYLGTPGRSPGDIDVLVIGAADEDTLYDIGTETGRRLGREVNIRRVRPERWHTDTTSGFLQTVRSRPMVSLVGGNQ